MHYFIDTISCLNDIGLPLEICHIIVNKYKDEHKKKFEKTLNKIGLNDNTEYDGYNLKTYCERKRDKIWLRYMEVDKKNPEYNKNKIRPYLYHLYKLNNGRWQGYYLYTPNHNKTLLSLNIKLLSYGGKHFNELDELQCIPAIDDYSRYLSIRRTDKRLADEFNHLNKKMIIND